VWVLGLLLAGAMGAATWLMLQPPWRRWRWWGRLKRRITHLRAGGAETRSDTTTSMITMTTHTPPWLAPLKHAGGKAGAETPAAGTGTDAATSSSDTGKAGSRKKTSTRARRKRRRKHITNATLPVIRVPRSKK